MTPKPPPNRLTEAEKDALILAQAAVIAQLTVLVAELEAKLNEPPKTSDNSSVPPSKGQKANRPEKAKRVGPRKGSLGRKGGGRPLAAEPDQTVIAKACPCESRGRPYASTARRRWARRIRRCTGVTTRSICRRSARW